jgi:predicted adenine nucleotide alpha hydrolase (AANH) superfamily ATPase
MAKTLLLHCCCAHCTAYSIEHWRRQGYQVHGLWYNPNIHPYSEHRQRLEAMKALAAEMDMPLEIVEGYDIHEYLGRVIGNEAERCRHCFELRLSKLAEVASGKGFDAFSSTLLISPHQQHELLCEVGEKLSCDAEFAYEDLRKRYSDSRHITKGLDLYRQQYCGCVFSEWERYSGLKLADVMGKA